MDAREATRRNDPPEHLLRIRAMSDQAVGSPVNPKPQAIVERRPLEADLFASRNHVPDAFESRCGAMGQVSEPVN